LTYSSFHSFFCVR